LIPYSGRRIQPAIAAAALHPQRVAAAGARTGTNGRRQRSKADEGRALSTCFCSWIYPKGLLLCRLRRRGADAPGYRCGEQLDCAAAVNQPCTL